MSCKVFQGRPASAGEAKCKCGLGRKALFRHKIANLIIAPGPAADGVRERAAEGPNTFVWVTGALNGAPSRGELERHQNAPRADRHNRVCIMRCEDQAIHFMFDEFHTLMKMGRSSLWMSALDYTHKTRRVVNAGTLMFASFPVLICLPYNLVPHLSVHFNGS